MARSSRNSGPDAAADINITPFVDVILVLLIVFMVAAPMLEQGLDVNLPQTAAQQLNKENDKINLKVSVDKEQRIMVINSSDEDKEGRIVPPTELKALMESYAPHSDNLTVNVEADAALEYGFLAQVMSTIKQANVKKVNLLTRPISSD